MDSPKPHRHWRRISLRALFGASTVAIIILATVCNRAHYQRKTVDQLIDRGARVYASRKTTSQFTKADFWRHFIYNVSALELRPTEKDDADSQILLASSLRGIRTLAVHPGRFGNERRLDADSNGGMTDDGAHLIATRFSSLDEFHTYAALCSDKGLQEIQNSLVNADRIQIHLRDNPVDGLFVRSN